MTVGLGARRRGLSVSGTKEWEGTHLADICLVINKWVGRSGMVGAGFSTAVWTRSQVVDLEWVWMRDNETTGEVGGRLTMKLPREDAVALSSSVDSVAWASWI